MPSCHEAGIYANWPHALHRRCNNFPHSSGHNCSISFAIPSGPVAFCFREDRTVVTSSCSKSSGTLKCSGETPQEVGCDSWTCFMYTEGSRELPSSVAVAALLAHTLMIVLTLFDIKDGVSSWTGRLNSSRRALFLSGFVLLINLSKSLYFCQNSILPLRFHFW